jgi:DNA-binding NarL/FixJ family response regulator
MSALPELSPEIVSVLVADSNQTQSQLLSSALRRQGSLKVNRCAAEMAECLSVLESEPADVILVADGVTRERQPLYELVRGIHSVHPQAGIVLLLDSYDRELVINALRAGARGLFCLASLPFKSLCRCITSVHHGQFWTNTEQMRFVVDALSVGPAAHFVNSRGQVVLTPREEQTVNLVSEGLNNREIATDLQVKEGTVKKSLLRIYDKLGVSNRVELVLYALSHREERAAEAAEEELVMA